MKYIKLSFQGKFIFCNILMFMFTWPRGGPGTFPRSVHSLRLPRQSKWSVINREPFEKPQLEDFLDFFRYLEDGYFYMIYVYESVQVLRGPETQFSGMELDMEV